MANEILQPFCFNKDCILHKVSVRPGTVRIDVHAKQMRFERKEYKGKFYCEECSQDMTRIVLPETRIITL